MIYLKTKKKLFIMLSALSVVFFVFACGMIMLSFNKTGASADTAHYSPVIPSTEVELKQLTSPSGAVYLANDKIATVQDDNKKVVVYALDGTFTQFVFTEISQIKAFGENLLVADDGNIKIIDVATNEVFPLSSDNPVSGKYFDLNERYLIRTIDSIIKIYEISGQTVSEVTDKTVYDMNGNRSIAINDQDDIFYFIGNSLYKRNINSFSTITEIAGNLSTTSKTNVLADNNYFYFIDEDKIYRKNIGVEGQATQLSVSPTDFDLGNLSTPVNISFKGENLFITDKTLSAVQEFSIDGTALFFTGYAIANGKTAFNRISAAPKLLSANDNSVAALDDSKITVIKNVYGDMYAQNNFINITLDGLGITPDVLCLGDNTLLVANKSARKIKVYGLTATATLQFEYTFSGNDLTDVCYFNGVYYVAQISEGNTTDTGIFALTENATAGAVPELYLTATDNFGAKTLVTADVSGNVILVKGGYVYKVTDSQCTKLNDEVINGTIVKICADLAGNVFAMTENGLYCVGDDVRYFPFNDGTLKSFALSYDKKDVFFIVEGQERIYKTNYLPNIAGNKIPAPDIPITTGTTADISKFKSLSVSKAIPLTVNFTEGQPYFDFVELKGGAVNEYVFLCEKTIQETDNVNGGFLTLTINVFAGINDKFKPTLFAVAAEYTEDTTANTKKAPSAQTKYVTTDVNAYYVPIIANGGFLIKDGETVLRLAAKTKLNALYEIEYSEMNQKFYYVSVEKDGETVHCYIPANFTADQLTEQKEGETVASQINSDNQTSLRNSLIVIALSASVFGTSLFFILKKKN